MKRIIKKTLKGIGIFLASFIGFALVYFAAAYCLSRITVNKGPEKGDYTTIYIRTNGAHTDLVLPLRTDVMDWGTFVKIDDTIGKDHSARYVAFGWGDKGFYMDIDTWDELTFPIAFKAAFALSTSAMHVTFYKRMVENDRCKSMTIRRDQYEKLVGYISDRFEKDSAGQPVYIETDAQYGDHDAFYEAKGRYNLFFTCNTWANRALKECGQKAAVWTIFDTGIFYHYREE